MMATAVTFAEADGVEDVTPPSDSRPLPVKRFPKSTVSCWEFSDDERSEFANTGLIWVSSRTFGQLDEPPPGERWQPNLSVTAKKSLALAGWGEFSVPASDRLVRFDDNHPAIEEIRSDLSSLAETLRGSNSTEDFSYGEIEGARRELFIIDQMLACGGCRVDWVLPAAKSTLAWIALKAGEGLVQTAALAVLVKLIGLITDR
jgi:hypothetical protein